MVANKYPSHEKTDVLPKAKSLTLINDELIYYVIYYFMYFLYIGEDFTAGTKVNFF